jgi:hypothetical protein
MAKERKKAEPKVKIKRFPAHFSHVLFFSPSSSHLAIFHASSSSSFSSYLPAQNICQACPAGWRRRANVYFAQKARSVTCPSSSSSSRIH